jgi:hypothetical protein
MKTLILHNHIVTLTDNGNLEIDKTQHATGKFKEREDTTVLRFTPEEAEKIREFLEEPGTKLSFLRGELFDELLYENEVDQTQH